MKAALLLLLAALTWPATASHLGLNSVKQPLYLHGSEQDPRITITDVPFATLFADPEWRFSAICQPFIPSTDGSWATPHDVNLASLYGIKVSGTFKQGTLDVLVVIDASKATAPETYPFTLEQVLDAVETCVKLMYPPRPKEEGTLEIQVKRPKG